MRILVVGLTKGSQITRLKEEAEKIGHVVVGCRSSDLVIKNTEDVFEAKINNEALNVYDLIYLCAGVESKKRYEWFSACAYYRENFGTRIVNQVAVLRDGSYFPTQTWFIKRLFESKIPQPETFVVYNGATLEEIAREIDIPFIIKISDTHQGKGIFIANSAKEGKEIINSKTPGTFLIRKFIPNEGDVRIFCVGYKAIGAMKRISQKGDFRSNISAGGTGEPFDLNMYPEIRKMAENSVKACGIEIAGVDIIMDKTTGKPYVLEVNVGPQFKGFEKYTGINAAKEIIEYFIRKK